LYVDGEMPAPAMQERLAGIVQSFDAEAAPEALRLITPDLQEEGIPDLSTPEGQAQIDHLIGDARLLILDNLSTLCRNGRENEADSWQGMQDWALRLRKSGISVLFIHHAAKGGQQRGTSRREDVLDTVIRLEHPSDYRAEDGARFEVHLDKARTIVGEAANSFEAHLGADSVWTFKALEDAQMQRVMDLHKEGLSVREIADELEMKKSSVQRRIAKARELGLIE
jgi:putative DNA primase/helicase